MKKINETTVNRMKTPDLSVDDISSIKLHVTEQSQALYAFNLYRAILKLETDRCLKGIPFPDGITRELLIRLKRRILNTYGGKIRKASFPNYVRSEMTRQTAFNVIRHSTIQPEYRLKDITNQPIGVPIQETKNDDGNTTTTTTTSAGNNSRGSTSTVSKKSVDRYLD